MTQRVVLNKSVLTQFTLFKDYEAGIVLQGWEVKSIRANRVELKGAHVMIHQGQASLENITIHPLAEHTQLSEDVVKRSRVLLLHHREIIQLSSQVKQRGYTIVVTRLYWKKTHVKLQLYLAKGKAMYDQRETIRQREMQRDMAQKIKNFNN
jgi:SsrA-binding protein